MIAGLSPQFVSIDADAGLFDLGQQRDERSFEVPVQIPQTLLAQLDRDQIGQTARDAHRVDGSTVQPSSSRNFAYSSQRAAPAAWRTTVHRRPAR